MDLLGLQGVHTLWEPVAMSFQACPVSSSLTSSLISLAKKACEGIEAMLHSMRMLAEPVASSFERHSFPKHARTLFLATRGIQDGQSPIHCLCQLKKNLIMSVCLGREFKEKGKPEFRENSNRCGEAGKEATNKDHPGINMALACPKAATEDAIEVKLSVEIMKGSKLFLVASH
jgi:hypothetical protein